MKKSLNNFSNITDNIRSYMLERRMCSAINLAQRFKISITELKPLIKKLKDTGMIRTVQKSCGSSCESCSSCDTPPDSDEIKETAIIISLERKDNINDSC